MTDAKPRSFAEFLRATREDIGFTQEELAATVRVSRRSITRWEANESRPSSTQAARLIVGINEIDGDAAIQIADLLGVPRHILPAPPALPEPVVDPRALDAAFLETLVAGADALDVAPKRLRAALAVLVARWRAAGLSLDDIQARLTAKP